MKSKQKYLIFILFFIIFSISNNNYYLNKVEAHYISSAEEWTIGKTYVRLFEASSNNISITEDGFLNFIAGNLIVGNPDKLNWYDSPKHKRYLSPIKLVACRNGNRNSFTFPGGFIYMTKDMLDLLNARNNEAEINRGDIRSNYMTDMYNNSNVTFVIAHEISHWMNEDWLRIHDKQDNANMIGQIVRWSNNGYPTANQKLMEQYLTNLASQSNKDINLKFEGEADISAMELVDNTFYMSNGSALTFFKRIMSLEYQSGIHMQKNTDSSNVNPHPDTSIRYNNILKYITEKSNGRVVMDSSGRLYFDGKLWYKDGYAPSRKDVTREERTNYTAGMLESLVYKNLLEHSKTYISDITTLDDRVQKNQTVIIGNVDYKDSTRANNKKGKIVDNFKVTATRTNQLIHNETKPVTEEEQYMMYYYNFLKDKNHS